MMNHRWLVGSKLVSLCAAAALSLAPSTAEALSCSVATVVGVSLGGYDVFSNSPLDSAGSVTYSCTGVGANDLIVIQLGRGGSSTYLPRQLKSGAWSLEYNLYLDAARTQVWGDGNGGTAKYGPFKPPEGTHTTVNLFGRAPAGQNIAVGTYTDSIVVTILY